MGAGTEDVVPNAVGRHGVGGMLTGVSVWMDVVKLSGEELS